MPERLRRAGQSSPGVLVIKQANLFNVYSVMDDSRQGGNDIIPSEYIDV